MQPSWIGLIAIGIIAGWLTGKIVRGAGYGVLGDLLLGLVGAVMTNGRGFLNPLSVQELSRGESRG